MEPGDVGQCNSCNNLLLHRRVVALARTTATASANSNTESKAATFHFHIERESMGYVVVSIVGNRSNIYVIEIGQLHVSSEQHDTFGRCVYPWQRTKDNGSGRGRYFDRRWIS